MKVVVLTIKTKSPHMKIPNNQNSDIAVFLHLY